MYHDKITTKERMKKFKGSASSSNLLGKMMNEKVEAKAKSAMSKALSKAKK